MNKIRKMKMNKRTLIMRSFATELIRNLANCDSYKEAF